MKKLRSIMALALAAAMLTGCAGKKTESESAPEFSDSPFSTTTSATTSEPQEDNYEELFGKYQFGGIRFDNYSIQGNSAIEYNGGEIEFSFDMNTNGNKYDAESGFMAFINGVPQKLSLNGGDYLELAAKNGYLNVLKLELEGIKERDIIYAVAVPINAETGSMTVRKGKSVLVLNEDDIQTESVPVTPIDPPDDTPETSDTTPGDMNTNIYAYHPEEYLDSEQRYLLLSKHGFESHEETLYDYIVYDEAEKKVVGTFTIPEDNIHDLSYSDGVLTLNVTDDDAVERGENPPRFVVYNEKFEPIKALYNEDIPDCYSMRYYSSKKWWVYNKEDGLYRANEDFSEEVRLSTGYVPKFYIVGDKIVYYKIIRNISAPQNDADILGVMDIDGNVISETKVASSGGGFRLKKAGNKIIFMSPLCTDTYGVPDSEFMDGIIIYDCKTGEQKTLYPENENERCYCDVSPDGKYLVTGILVKENYYTYTDNILKLYDLDTLELIGSKTLGTPNALDLCVFNDRAMLCDLDSKTYMFKTDY